MNFETFQSHDLEILKQARESWESGDKQLALKQFESATKDHPENLRGYLEYATALAKSYRIGEACHLLERSRKIGGRDGRGVSEIAKCYASMFRLPQAIDCLQTFSEELQSGDNEAQLAVYYEQSGRFEEAQEAISRFLKAAPNQPEPKLILARILTHQGQLERAYEILIQLAKSWQNPDPKLAIRTYYDLAVVLDRMGNFKHAVQAAMQAKEIQKQAPNAERMARSATEQIFQLSAIYQQLDSATLQRWLSTEFPALPEQVRPAHLIGYPRSGTTLLEQVLDAHPNLVTSSERMVFAEEILPELMKPESPAHSAFEALNSISHDRLCQLRKHYMDCLRATHPGDFSALVHVDKKPANTPVVFGLLRLLPESKFVVSIRDPRDVVVSCFMRYFPLTGSSSRFLSWGSTAISYAQIMEIWLYMREILPAENWLEIHYEDVCEDVGRQASKVLQFLDLPDDPAVDNYLDSTQSKYVHSPTFAEVRRPVHRNRVGRWEHYAEHLEPFFGTLEPFVKSLGYG